MNLGKQEKGSSNYFTKRMAIEAISLAQIKTEGLVAADIGAGVGELTSLLSPRFRKIYMADVFAATAIPENAEFVFADLNDKWGISNESIDFLFGLEVIEHIENPRHFFREVTRVLKKGGHLYLTTPNNHSIYSKLTFFFKGEHRYFQDPSYPAHITALTKKDFQRIAAENGLAIVHWSYANEDAFPGLHFRLKIPGKLFSQSIGVLMKKP